MSESRFLTEIRAAKNAIAEAEDDLGKLLHENRGALRADKVTVSAAVQGAFDKVRAAREHLVSLENLAGEPDELPK